MRRLFHKILCALAVVVWFGLGGAATSSASPKLAKSKAVINFDELADALAPGKLAGPVLKKLGKPTAIMPGRGNDPIYHYTFPVSKNKQVLLVIIVDENGKVFRHRFYVKDCNVAMC